MKKIFAALAFICISGILAFIFIFKTSLNNENIYTLLALDGTKITFKKKEEELSNSYNKPYLLVFMTSWCSYCLGQAKHLANIHDDFGDKVNIYGIFTDKSENIEELNQFVVDSNTKFPWFYKGDILQLLDSCSINTFPFFLLYDRDGTLFMSYDGITPEEMIAFDIKRLLKE